MTQAWTCVCALTFPPCLPRRDAGSRVNAPSVLSRRWEAFWLPARPAHCAGRLLRHGGANVGMVHVPQSVRRRALLVVAAFASDRYLDRRERLDPGPAATNLQARVELRLRDTGGRPVVVSAVAPILRQAVVATEDERFYRHHGIDMIGVIRALPYDLVHLSFAQGASTITEQVGKLLYLGGNDHSLWRKLEDATLALKLEDRYTKEQILARVPQQRLLRRGRLRHLGGKPPTTSASRRGGWTTAQATLLAGTNPGAFRLRPDHGSRCGSGAPA